MRPGRRHFWSNLLAVAYKEAAVMRHDRPFLAVAFVQPIMMMTIFSAVSNQPANVPWTVLDRSHTSESRRLIDEIGATGYFLPPAPAASYDAGGAMLRDRRALAFLVIPRDFARDLERGGPRVQVLLDGADPLSAARVGGIIAQVSAAFRTEPPERNPLAAPVRRPGAIEVRQRFWFNPTLRDREFFMSALAAMLLTNLCLSATSLALVGERENGTYEQMLALPTTPVEIVLGKLLPYVVLCYIEVLVALIPIGLVFGYWPQGSWLTLFLITLPFILASLALGTFISSVANNSTQSVFLSVFFILPSFVLSGVMMPYQLMPDGVRQLGAMLPLRWYQIAARRVIERGAGLADVAVPDSRADGDVRGHARGSDVAHEAAARLTSARPARPVTPARARAWSSGREWNGEGGIRTHGRCYPTHAFQACSFSHSDTSPTLRSCDPPAITAVHEERRGWDSNPRRPKPHTISSRAVSTVLTHLSRSDSRRILEPDETRSTRARAPLLPWMGREANSAA